jgi:hypothetical protein
VGYQPIEPRQRSERRAVVGIVGDAQGWTIDA